MKTSIKKLFIYSCSSLATLATCSAFADEMAYAPSLDGGLTASVGTFYVVPDSASQEYTTTVAPIDFEGLPDARLATDGYVLATPVNNDGQYDFGIQASLGYIFEDTANGIELSYRGLDADSDASTSGLFLVPETGGQVPTIDVLSSDVDNTINYQLDSADLMISQFLNIGEHMQLRFLGGLAYVNLEQDNNTNYSAFEKEYELYNQTNSDFQGFGPRLGLDTRYDFGHGFGIVGGGSVAYLLGELDSNESFEDNNQGNLLAYENNMDSHTVVNLRANLGVDYVHFLDNDERSTIGLELGYLVDYYIDAVNQMSGNQNGTRILACAEFKACVSPIDTNQTGSTAGRSVATELSSVSFSGPYLNLKGTF